MPGSGIADVELPTSTTAAGALHARSVDDHVTELTRNVGIMTAVNLAAYDKTAAQTNVTYV
jgi:hypothetical protein